MNEADRQVIHGFTESVNGLRLDVKDLRTALMGDIAKPNEPGALTRIATIERDMKTIAQEHPACKATIDVLQRAHEERGRKWIAKQAAVGAVLSGLSIKALWEIISPLF